MASRTDKDSSRKEATVTTITSERRARRAARTSPASADRPPVSHDPDAAINLLSRFDLTEDEQTAGIGEAAISEYARDPRHAGDERRGAGRSVDEARVVSAGPAESRRRRWRNLPLRPWISTRHAVGIVAVLVAIAAGAIDVIPGQSAADHRPHNADVSAQHSTVSNMTAGAILLTERRADHDAHGPATHGQTKRTHHTATGKRHRARTRGPRARRAHTRTLVTDHARRSHRHAGTSAPTYTATQASPPTTTTVITTTEPPPTNTTSARSAAPAGPIGPGSSSGGCNPQCR